MEYCQKHTFVCYATRHQETMEILDFSYMFWELGKQWHSLLRHCATRWEVPGLFAGGVLILLSAFSSTGVYSASNRNEY